MSPVDFVRTIYLGDRCCTAFLVDSAQQEVRIQVDLISRIRGDSWNFYSEEDVPDGWLVFEGLVWEEMTPKNMHPNDWVEFVSVVPLPGEQLYTFRLSLGASVPSDARVREVELIINAKDICIEDALGARIRG